MDFVKLGNITGKIFMVLAVILLIWKLTDKKKPKN